jgi:hypothetical protein
VGRTERLMMVARSTIEDSDWYSEVFGVAYNCDEHANQCGTNI